MAEISKIRSEFGDSNSDCRAQFLIGRSPNFGKLGPSQMKLGLAGDLSHINFDLRYLNAANNGSLEPSAALFPSKLSSVSNHRIPKHRFTRAERIPPLLYYFAHPHIKSAIERRFSAKSFEVAQRKRFGSTDGQ